MSVLSIVDIETLRAQSAPLPCTVAAFTSADDFKSPNNNRKPLAKNLDHHYSVESRRFSGSALKKAASVKSTRSIISLGTGRPTPDYYPWDLVSFQGFSRAGETRIGAKFKSHNGSNGHSSAPSCQSSTKQDEGYNLALALNYGHGVGSPHLLRFITEHTELVHNPAYSNWGTCLTVGTTSALEIAFRIFCDRGDTILTEEYTYPGTIEAAGLLGLNIQAMRLDFDGVNDTYLKKLLDTWNLSCGPKPRVLYTIPCGQNPTGATQSLERRHKILQIAEEHDLIIFEDDPYFFLRLGGVSEDTESSTAAGGVCSYLSLDTSGRVVRFDSASKILAPGMRAGWVVANSSIIEKFIAYSEVSTVAVSGPVQLMLCKLLDESWGHRGFFSWLDHLSLQYRSRRDLLLDACERFLPRDICSWVSPDYGMFLWVKLDWSRHPRFRNQTSHKNLIGALADIENNLLTLAFKNGVQVTKGSLFHCNKSPSGELHFRLTFAAAVKEDLGEGVRIFAEAVKYEFLIEQ
ncbi:L-kynurenine/alpha-aminoadipate aminotransferase [Penicillium pulvis]|uniref:L-kynurenine/alpha-aminoadipate aminotransferase n=1 Tax=Penicillium pulvis TaxID=1562058 RepID=UPI0025474043|nr:L-kynurenine/alpha-aminoadipate aminotransferase [Penicillium pulvis]KAJ5798631.1 L-kynurenine/alpha-aminoadipate aminotransferase [Penicillium pulvis]